MLLECSENRERRWVSLTDDFLFRQYINQGARFLFSNINQKRECARRARERWRYNVFTITGGFSAAGGHPPPLIPLFFPSSFAQWVQKKERCFLKRILFSLLFFCMCVAFWTPELVLFCFCWAALFALCVTHKKGIFLLRVCILDDASDLPRDILQFVLQERKERVFEKEPTEKHTSKEREREKKKKETRDRKF